MFCLVFARLLSTLILIRKILLLSVVVVEVIVVVVEVVVVVVVEVVVVLEVVVVVVVVVVRANLYYFSCSNYGTLTNSVDTSKMAKMSHHIMNCTVCCHKSHSHQPKQF